MLGYLISSLHLFRLCFSHVLLFFAFVFAQSSKHDQHFDLSLFLTLSDNFILLLLFDFLFELELLSAVCFY